MRVWRWVSVLLTLGFLLVACQVDFLSSEPEPGKPPTPVPTVVPTPSPIPTEAATPEPTATPTETPEPTPTPLVAVILPTPAAISIPLAQLRFGAVRAVGNLPSQIQIVFSLRDESGHSVTVSADELRNATRIFELAAAASSPENGGTVSPDGEGESDSQAQQWQEIDYAETTFFVHTAENLELEVVFVLDFTNSMAQATLLGGRSGTEAMLDALERVVNTLPEPHRIGVVEFHDRSVEPSVVSELTTDRSDILDAVNAFANSQFEPGSSRLWDSIQTAADIFTSRQDNPNVVRALVFISDGRDTSSLGGRGDALQIADQYGIQQYAMGIGEVFEEEQLAGLVRSTGGGLLSDHGA